MIYIEEGSILALSIIYLNNIILRCLFRFEKFCGLEIKTKVNLIFITIKNNIQLYLKRLFILINDNSEDSEFIIDDICKAR